MTERQTDGDRITNYDPAVKTRLLPAQRSAQFAQPTYTSSSAMAEAVEASSLNLFKNHELRRKRLGFFMEFSLQSPLVGSNVFTSYSRTIYDQVYDYPFI